MAKSDDDIKAVLAKRHDNGADFWATPDGRIYVGSPFSTISSLGILYELGVKPTHEAVKGGLAQLVDAVRDDGRIQVAPKAPLYPCYTAEAARMLCRFGLTKDKRVRRVIDYLLGDVHKTGGWRCSFSRFGKGPETEYANPGATLFALDALRFYPELRKGHKAVDAAVESLLDHWDVRKPVGPCHYGIGSAFMKVEYPFMRYNLFYYVYVLSSFGRAGRDKRFKEALALLSSRLDEDGRLVVEAPHRGLKGLVFCAKGQPSPFAQKRYDEIKRNVAK